MINKSCHGWIMMMTDKINVAVVVNICHFIIFTMWYACTCRLLNIFLNCIDSILFCKSIFSNDYSWTRGGRRAGAPSLVGQNHPMYDVTSGLAFPWYFEGKNSEERSIVNVWIIILECRRWFILVSYYLRVLKTIPIINLSCQGAAKGEHDHEKEDQRRRRSE